MTPTLVATLRELAAENERRRVEALASWRRVS